jgi:hypothetical protein
LNQLPSLACAPPPEARRLEALPEPHTLFGPATEQFYQWKFGRDAECVKYAYAAQAITAATTMRRMVLLAMVKRLLLGVPMVSGRGCS